MASEGPNSPLTGADDSSVGTVAWINPTRVTSSDNSRSNAPRSSSSSTTHYLKATGFRFDVPYGSTIDGILVEIEKSKIGGLGSCSDNRVSIVKSDGSIGSTNKAAGGNWSGTDSYTSYGGSSDLWGETWTYSDINDSDFGVVIRANLTVGAESSVDAAVDHIRITVYYTEPVYFGNITKEDTGMSSFLADRVAAGAVTLSEDGDVSAVVVFVVNDDSGSAHNIDIAIYEDSSGVPGNKIASTGSSSVAASFNGWKGINLSQSLTAGDYWLAVNTDSGDINYGWAEVPSASIEKWTDTFGTWTNSPSISTLNSDTTLSIYAIYTASGGGGSATPTLMLMGCGV